jgi:exopolysaccharide biosynthesis polyprenyl glycosylphosphotransferase
VNASDLHLGRLTKLHPENLRFQQVEKEEIEVVQEESVINPEFGADFHEKEPVDVFHPLEDDRAIRMLSILDNQSYKSSRTNQRIYILMMVWIIRYKIQNHLKRFFDLVLSCLALPIFLPMIVVTAVAIKLSSPGPVFFKQVRVGKWGKPFDCYKFRSMYVDAEQRKTGLMHLNEADQIVFKMKRDPRVTGVGRIIRKLSIDELPQIFNVIKGDMSLVGPRPPVPYEVENYKYEHILRLNAVPGLTGLQQVSGRSELEFKRWVELDLQYIEEQSLIKDIEIILKTIPAVITGRGAY